MNILIALFALSDVKILKVLIKQKSILLIAALIITPVTNHAGTPENSQKCTFAEFHDNLGNFPPYGSEKLINMPGGSSNCNHVSPYYVKTAAGSSCVTWIDYRNGHPDIFLQVYDVIGNKIGPNVRVNDTPLFREVTFCTSMHESGGIAIIWFTQDYKLKIQRFASNGQKEGAPAYLIENAAYLYGIAKISAGINLKGDIYVNLISNFGSLSHNSLLIADKNNNIKLSPVLLGSYENNPDCYTNRNILPLDFDMLGNAGIISIESTAESRLVKIHNVNSNDYSLSEKTIYKASAGESLSNPSIAALDSGYFILSWEDRYKDSLYSHIKLAVFDNYFQSLISTESFFPHWNYSDLCVATDRKSKYYLMGMKYDTITAYEYHLFEQGQKSIITFNNVFPAYTSASPANFSHIFTIPYSLPWRIYSKSGYNLYLRKYPYLPQADTLGAIINDDTLSSSEKRPRISCNRFGDKLILWDDYRNGSRELFAQILNKDDMPVGQNLSVMDTTAGYYYNFTDILALSDGSFLILFDKNYLYHRAISCQKVSRMGEKIGINNDLTVPEMETYFKTAIDDKDNITMARTRSLISAEETEVTYYLQKLDRNFSAISPIRTITHKFPPFNSQFIFLPDSRFIFIDKLDVSIQNKYQTRLYGTIFASNDSTYSEGPRLIESFPREASFEWVNYYSGNFHTGEYLILESSKSIYASVKKDKLHHFRYDLPDNNDERTCSVIYCNNNKLLLLWNDSMRIFAGYFNFNKQSANYYYVTEILNVKRPEFSAVIDTIDKTKPLIHLAYERSNDSGTGIDIYTRSFKLPSSIDLSPEEFIPSVQYDVLLHNYPNPFNSSTIIQYSLVSPQNVRLAIYDILGREVNILVNEFQLAGKHEVKFDAGGLASGVYFYKLEAFDTIVKKMIILK